MSKHNLGLGVDDFTMTTTITIPKLKYQTLKDFLNKQKKVYGVKEFDKQSLRVLEMLALKLEEAQTEELKAEVQATIKKWLSILSEGVCVCGGYGHIELGFGLVECAGCKDVPF